MYHSSRLSLIIIVIAKKLILSAFSVYFGILRICFPCFLGIIFIVLHYSVDAQEVPSYLPSHLSSFTPPRRFLPSFTPFFLHSFLHSFITSFLHSFLQSFLHSEGFFLPSFTPFFLHSSQKVLPTFFHPFLPSLLTSFTPYSTLSSTPSFTTSVFHYLTINPS